MKRLTAMSLTVPSLPLLALAAAALAALLAGCSMTPPLTRPESPIPRSTRAMSMR